MSILTLVNKIQTARKCSVVWDGKNDSGTVYYSDDLAYS